MARMIPDFLRPDTKSQAERQLYGLFQQQLDDQFTVFHQMPWQLRDLRNGAQDGEADFIIAHPDLGILVLEVKGGIIHYDGRAVQRFSNNNAIKDPFEQARSSKYSLLNLLHEQGWQRWLTVGYAVAFPDSMIKQHMLRPDAPRDIVLDCTQLHDLSQWVKMVLEHYRGQDQRDGGPGNIGIEELMRLLSPSLNFKPLLGYVIEQEADELLRLTEQQFRLLDYLSRQRRVSITGCAGSGKTVLAVEKARRLAEQGFRVLLTCFNRNLAEFLRASLGIHPNIHVAHFHGLCEELIRQAHLPQTTERSAQFWEETAAELVITAAELLNWSVDAIIVDEGQDFRDSWWIALQYLLNDPDNGILYVFYDDNQRLYPGGQIALESTPIPLRENCRNTQGVHRFVRQFYRGDLEPIALGPIGRDVEFLSFTTTDDLKRHLRRQLHWLVSEEGVPVEDIVILTPRSREQSRLSTFGALGNFHLVDHPSNGGDIFYTSIHQYKGLESPVVILAEVESETAQDLNTLMYVGSSRACHHLIVITHADLDFPLE
jgi:hypothetical protein